MTKGTRRRKGAAGRAAEDQHVVWFVDRSFGGRIVPAALRERVDELELDDTVHALDEIFPDRPTIEDEEWLTHCGQNGWIALSRDKAIRRRRHEIEALRSAGVGAFFMKSKGKTGPQLADVMAASLKRMRKVVLSYARPFVFTVDGRGRLERVEGERAAAERARRGGLKRTTRKRK